MVIMGDMKMPRSKFHRTDFEYVVDDARTRKNDWGQKSDNHAKVQIINQHLSAKEECRKTYNGAWYRMISDDPRIYHQRIRGSVH